MLHFLFGTVSFEKLGHQTRIFQIKAEISPHQDIILTVGVGVCVGTCTPASLW